LLLQQKAKVHEIILFLSLCSFAATGISAVPGAGRFSSGGCATVPEIGRIGDNLGSETKKLRHFPYFGRHCRTFLAAIQPHLCQRWMPD
jgi:hypothetical protein